MQLMIRRLPHVLVVCGLIVASAGCSSTTPPPDHASEFLGVAPEGAAAGPKEAEPLLSEVTRLRLAAQESFDAAIMIGTPEAQLAEARAALDRADRFIQEARAATARDTQQGWQQLQGAESTLRQAEEAAVRAGLTHIEQELAAGYAQVLSPKSGDRRQLWSMVRVTQGTAYLRGGAGIDFQVVGKVRQGETLNITAEVGNWYHVRSRSGVEGWVAKDLVTRVPSL